MNEGLLYPLSALVLTAAVLGGYLLYLVRRERLAKDILDATAPAPPGERAAD